MENLIVVNNNIDSNSKGEAIFKVIKICFSTFLMGVVINSNNNNKGNNNNNNNSMVNNSISGEGEDLMDLIWGAGVLISIIIINNKDNSNNKNKQVYLKIQVLSNLILMNYLNFLKEKKYG